MVNDNFVNLHRHSMMSLFDAFGKHEDAAKYAKKMGQKALGLTDHGTVSGLMGHYNACNEVGIKPILGCEVYFQPDFNKEKESFHLNLIAKNIAGYSNLMMAISEASRNNFYRKPIIDFDILKRRKNGLICMSACSAGLISKLITSGAKKQLLVDIVTVFKELFNDDFYLEVMPIKFAPQYKINRVLVKLGKITNTKVVMTMDSHFVEKEDYDSYLMMHKLKKDNFSIDYSERFMPTEKEIIEFWYEMHPKINPQEFINNTSEVADKCNIKFNFKNMVPKLEEIKNGKKSVVEFCKQRLRREHKTSKVYKDRLIHELKVIFSHNLEDYFLLCRDIVGFAKKSGIKVGPGRGSAGGCLVAYSLGITDVDPIILGTKFERFLKKDKKKLPDIDIDFDSNRRSEVIDYILQKYEGKAAQIATFGFYKVRNLVNDLAKVMYMKDSDRGAAKKILEMVVDSTNDNFTLEMLNRNSKLKSINKQYPGFLKHFYKIYNQCHFIGRHAAGVAIAPGDITKYVALQRTSGNLQTAYDLNGLGTLGVLKMDILGLSTLSIINDAEELIEDNVSLNDSILSDKKVYEQFWYGNTPGVFQFEKKKAVELLGSVKPCNIQELTACNSLNRPAPLKLGIADEYAAAKFGLKSNRGMWSKYCEDTHGVLIYQEQVMDICRNIGGLSWDDTDIVMKGFRNVDKEIIKKKFLKGAFDNGFKKPQSRELFEKMTLYLFNKSHAAAYSLISFYCMYLKLYYPLEFYCALIKNRNDEKLNNYLISAAKDGIVIMLPHVNYGLGTKILKIDGDKAISLCLTTIKGVGQKTAEKIDTKKPYASKEDFIKRACNGKTNTSIEEKLEHNGALLFNDKIYWERVIKYNAFLKNRNPSFY